MPGDYQGIGVPLSTFGGLVTDASPPETPQGVSPDCQDVAFLPGQVFQRPGLSRIFPSPFPGQPTTIYEKTYIQPNEQALNLFIDSANVFWREDVISNPGNFSQISILGARNSTQAQSATAFGREYVCTSDGVHGTFIPFQYDGTNIDRITQDGPGAGPSAADEGISGTIVASPNGLAEYAAITIAAAPMGLTMVGKVVTVTSTGIANFGLQFAAVGDLIKIAGSGIGTYNGTFTISAVISSVQVQFVHTSASGLAASGGGTANIAAGQVTLTSAISLTKGQLVTVAGAGVSGYNGTFVVRANVTASTQVDVTLGVFGLAASGNGTLTVAGTISVGVHKFVVMFWTRQGYITKPSPIASWTSAGGLRVILANIPLGPPNVIARIIAFTGAGGGNFFYIPTNFTLPGTTSSVLSTVINDNTTTSATLDFSDNALFASTAIDVAGRNYFAQVVLTDCLGVFPYASRMGFWGARNTLNRLLNMGFEGGYLPGPNVPLGWSQDTGNGNLVNGGSWDSGQAWVISGDGGGGNQGQLSQSAYLNENNLPIILPNTSYTFRCWANISTAIAGNLIAEFNSASLGSLAIASISVTGISQQGSFVSANFNITTPAVIPSDTRLLIYATGLPVGILLKIDELQIIPQQNPYLDGVFRFSYVNAPEQLDGVTGILGSTNDTSPIRNAFQLRNFMYFNTEVGKHSATDNGTGEPSTWSVPEVSQSVGSVSVHGTDAGRIGGGESGEQWEFTLSAGGVYVFAGGQDMKVSQEIQKPTDNGFPGWDSINKAAIQSSWIKNDVVNRRCYVGVPTGTATAPNVMFVLDYHNLDSGQAIAFAPPVREGVGEDLARKWTRWTLTMNCGEILCRGLNDYEFCVGAGTGTTPGNILGFGNVYTFDPTKLTDDDFGTIVPYYTTYFLPPGSKLGVHRHLASYLSSFITGVGSTSITPLVNTLANSFPSLPAYPLNLNQDHDYEWQMNVPGERIALKIGSVPSGTSSDNGFTLQHLIMTIKEHPISPLRGAM